jgi:hypothetical protein
MASVADMGRGIIAGAAIAVLIAFAIAFLGMIALFGINFAVMKISPDHYRRVVAEAASSGTLATVMHLPFAPRKDIYPYGGNDCVILGALVIPRGTPLEASVSPRMPTGADIKDFADPPGYPPVPFCLQLAVVVKTPGEPSRPTYLHRYVHGDITVAALLLAFMSFGTATTVLLSACYAMLAAVALIALARLRAGPQAERGRALAFLIIAATLAICYALPLFGRSFSFAPTDFVVFAFILYGMLRPLCRIPRHHFIVAAAAFGTLIAILEILTGGVPMGLATLIALVALGEAPDAPTLVDRVVVGTAAFTAAVVACFGYKMLAVGAAFGTNELSEFARTLGNRVDGSVEPFLSDNVRDGLRALHIDTLWIDGNALARILFAGVMLTYSAFFLGWGSHLVGAAVVLLPTPLLLAFGFASLRDRGRTIESRERLALAAAGMVPVLWYLVFANHTILHSSYMVRPLALNVALCIVSALVPRTRSSRTPSGKSNRELRVQKGH